MTEPSDNARRLDAAQWRGILDKVPLFFDVTSASMTPTFCACEQVFIRPLKEGEPKPGQVLAYFRGMLVTHRYLGDGVCLGDNALENDPPVAPEDMVGIVTAVRRNGNVVPLDARMPFRTRIHRLRLRIRQTGQSLKRAVRARMSR